MAEIDGFVVRRMLLQLNHQTAAIRHRFFTGQRDRGALPKLEKTLSAFTCASATSLRSSSLSSVGMRERSSAISGGFESAFLCHFLSLFGICLSLASASAFSSRFFFASALAFASSASLSQRQPFSFGWPRHQFSLSFLRQRHRASRLINQRYDFSSSIFSASSGMESDLTPVGARSLSRPVHKLQRGRAARGWLHQ